MGLVSRVYSMVPNATHKERKESQMDIEKMKESILKQIEWRKAYNKRASVKAKRSVYNKERWQQIKAVKAQLREEGLL